MAEAAGITNEAFKNAERAWQKYCSKCEMLREPVLFENTNIWRKLYSIQMKNEDLTVECAMIFADTCDEFVKYIQLKESSLLPAIESKIARLNSVLGHSKF